MYFRGAEVPEPKASALLGLLNREVFKARHRQSGMKVALKKVFLDNEKEGVRKILSLFFLVHRYFALETTM